MAKAMAENRPVEVSSLTTETQRVVADPESGNLLAEISAIPVRVERAGRWEPLDTRLVSGGDGKVVAAATTVDTVVDHGSRPFITVRDGTRSMSLSWREELPEPKLDGNLAIWPEVAPGIDLAVQVTPTGARQFLVVRTPAAATDPLLSELRLGFDAEGLVVSERNGGLVAESSDGAAVFSSSQLRMWESPVTDEGTAAETSAAAIRLPEQQGSRSSVVGLRVTDDQLVLTPDQAFLSDPTTRFPVVIDPAISRERSAWSMVWSDGQEFWDDGSEHARVGYDGWEGDKKSRVFYRFDASAFRNTTILSATLSHKQIHSARGCGVNTDVPGVEAWYTGGISSSTTWTNQPEWRSKLDTSYVAHGNSTQCPGFTPTEWNVKNGAQIVADEGWTTYTIGLRSANESEKLGWRQFDNDGTYPFISVTFNRAPNPPSTPSALEWVDYAGTKYVSDSTPTLRTSVSDPDGDRLDVRFTVDPAATGSASFTLDADGVPSGQVAQAAVPSGRLAHGNRYLISARSYDSRVWSPTSPTAEFWVDTDAPTPPTVTTPATNPKVGDPMSFTITGTIRDSAYYVWGLNTDTPSQRAEPSTLGGVATVGGIVVPQFGPNFITAYAVDRAGNRSTTSRTVFKVDGTLPSHRFRLDGNGTDTRTDTAPDGIWSADLTVPAGTSFTEGRFYRNPQGGILDCTDKALGVAPTSGVRNLTSSADPGDTSKQYAISAWVKPTGLAAVETGSGFEAAAVSTFTGSASAFMIGYRKTTADGTANWFLTLDDDGAYGGRSFMNTTVPVAVNAWTHLTAVWNPTTKSAALYVNGQLAVQRNLTTGVFNSDRLMVGGAPSGGFGTVGWQGVIDEVLLYQGVLDANQVEAISQAGRPSTGC